MSPKKEGLNETMGLLREGRSPRNTSGQRYKLGSILKLLLAGLLSGRQSLAQIVLWRISLSHHHRTLQIVKYLDRQKFIEP